MNKQTLVNAVSQKADLPVSSANEAVKALLDIVEQQLREGQEVRIAGFGSFATKIRKARSARNPITGEPIEIEEKTVPVFKPGKTLKVRVNEAR